MRKIWNKGHRIRTSDKHLVYHFSIGTLLFVFVAEPRPASGAYGDRGPFLFGHRR